MSVSCLNMMRFSGVFSLVVSMDAKESAVIFISLMKWPVESKCKETVASGSF